MSEQVPDQLPYNVIMPNQLSVPMLISVPHCGTQLSCDFSERVQHPDLLKLPDTDWFVNELYDFAPALGITMIHAVYSRYIIDLNRQLPGAENLYTNQSRTTGLVPLNSFDNQRIYKPGQAPQEAEIQRRITNFYQPYYKKIHTILTQLKKKFPIVMLYDGHSIKGQVEAIQTESFADYMPANRCGQTCPNTFIECAHAIISQHNCSCSANKPFQGGNITRNFYDKKNGIISFQMEISQRLYMNEISGEKQQPGWERTANILREIVERFAEILLVMNREK